MILFELNKFYLYQNKEIRNQEIIFKNLIVVFGKMVNSLLLFLLYHKFQSASNSNVEEYYVKEELGEGTFGIVFLAYSPK
ncbi:hypothetical protein H311_01271, partial [Anncaliia algerae PRA109]